MSSDLSGASFEELVAEMIRRLGDDPDREGLKRTPERVAKSLAFLTQGYGMGSRMWSTGPFSRSATGTWFW